MDGRSRILVVDDNPNNLTIMMKILGEDYELRTVTSGKEALEIAPLFQPEIILLDIMMPEMDGYQTCQRLREIPELRSPKIIMISAKAMVAERLEGYESGADDYITKPFDEEELKAKVRVYMQLRSMEEVNQLKTDILSLLSHEIRTPLHGILSPIEMLLGEEGVNEEEWREMLEIVFQSAKRLNSLMEKSMKFWAMKSGNWDFSLAPADLREVVGRVVRDFSEGAAEKGVTIQEELPPSAPAVLDSEKMEEVVAALLDNAIRFSDPGGEVMVQIRAEEEEILLVVRDHGEGIRPAELSKVFDGFAISDVLQRAEGHGLSLAIARHIVQAHHGTIAADSTEESGATFTVRLPAKVPLEVGIGPTPF